MVRGTSGDRTKHTQAPPRTTPPCGEHAGNAAEAASANEAAAASSVKLTGRRLGAMTQTTTQVSVRPKAT